jgi:hypothetical protein
VLLLVLSVAVAACGGSARAESDEERAFVAWVEAIEAGDARRVAELLPRRIRERLSDEQRAELVRVLRDRVAGAADDEPVLVVRVAGDAVVAGRRREPPGAYAAVLERESGEWKIVPGTVGLTYGLPAAGDELESPASIDFGVVPKDARLEAALWLDGRKLPLTRTETPQYARFAARPAQPLERGDHVVVAYARDGDRAGAIAWTFVVR